MNVLPPHRPRDLVVPSSVVLSSYHGFELNDICFVNLMQVLILNHLFKLAKTLFMQQRKNSISGCEIIRVSLAKVIGMD